MNLEEAHEKMLRIFNNGIHDTEIAHVEADRLLVELCRGLNLVSIRDSADLKDILDIYEKIEKWYA